MNKAENQYSVMNSLLYPIRYKNAAKTIFGLLVRNNSVC